MIALKQKPNYKLILKDVNDFVSEKLLNYDVSGVEGKTIHDPIWGSNEYSEWEMQIIDSPLIQRLRNISQVGLAVLTYPAARHSRFEHTLGVAAATKRLVDKINTNSNDTVIKPTVRNKLVLAAIMHDVGHCFYSHLSETIYGNLAEFVGLRKEIQEVYHVKPKPHEILSLIIVNSEAFTEFFKTKVNYPNKTNISKLLEDVGKIIIGVNIVEDGKINSYQTAIINGTFDVDKLDYIKRDSYTAGLALDFDIERLFTKIFITDVSIDGKIEKRLVIQANGVTAIEELTFCKIMLFSYIYYHQKVLITEDIIKDYVHSLLELDLINSYADFLRYNEFELLALAEKQGETKPYPEIGDINLLKLANNIKNRNLPKRCLEISQSVIQHSNVEPTDVVINQECSRLLEKIRNDKNFSEDSFYQEINLILSKSTSSPERYLAGFLSKYDKLTYSDILNVRKSIFEEICRLYKEENLSVTFDVFDIYFVLPPVVSYGSTSDKNILGRDGELLTISDFVKLDQWASSFNAYKWRGYVYVDEKIKKDIALKACRKVIFDDKIELEELKSFLKL